MGGAVGGTVGGAVTGTVVAGTVIGGAVMGSVVVAGTVGLAAAADVSVAAGALRAGVPPAIDRGCSPEVVDDGAPHAVAMAAASATHASCRMIPVMV